MVIIVKPQRKAIKAHGSPEAKIQSECVAWLWNNYPETRGLYFCVNNENSRSKYENRMQQLRSGAQRKAMGIIAGVSDTILLMSKRGYHGLCIEFKTETGRQSETQKSWCQTVEKSGYKYVVIRSLDSFKDIIKWYIGYDKD